MTRSAFAHPANGVRFELLLSSNDAGTARYEGHAHLPKLSVAITIATTVLAAETTLGDAEALSSSERATIEKLCTALVRAATRVELAKGEPVPQKIVRWRPLD